MTEKNNQWIQNRSPVLMIMVIIGCYFDSMFKIWILMIDYQEIDTKCQLAITTRIVFYYVAYIFIVLRIQRVHNYNKIQDQLYEATSKPANDDGGKGQNPKK